MYLGPHHALLPYQRLNIALLLSDIIDFAMFFFSTYLLVITLNNYIYNTTEK